MRLRPGGDLRPGKWPALPLHLVVVALPHFLQNVAHLVHPAALMPHSRIDRPNRRRQAGTAVGDDQAEHSALQSAPVQILQQAFPVGLAFALAAQESQQMPGAVVAHAVGHQHLHPLASRRTPHPQAHSVQKQIRVVVVQPRLMKLAHHFVQIPRQLRHRLRAHHFAGQVATTRPTCRVEMPRRNASRISSETSSARR